MAIQLDITEEQYGMLIADAYIKFCYLDWSDQTNKVTATFSVWSTPTAEAEGKSCIDHIMVDATALYPKIQEDMYKELKKLDKYKDAIDV